ncbi:hypothetical protein NDU88_005006 [Pleurodeles waltl]|uniref:Uncharacterized protein n=1 Tax=Pleurodeles waltl TaxID=8319 RepID=A0AAV7LNC5_PLEWA|nr:hypothetical protein NDU88_005006 [Pleurodeles waltl]
MGPLIITSQCHSSHRASEQAVSQTSTRPVKKRRHKGGQTKPLLQTNKVRTKMETGYGRRAPRAQERAAEESKYAQMCERFTQLFTHPVIPGDGLTPNYHVGQREQSVAEVADLWE